MSDRPVIGVLLDERLNPSADGDFSKRPYQALRFDYFDWIAERGGLPIALPFAAGCEDAYVAMCDAIVLTGSEYRFQNDWYVDGGASVPATESRRRFYEADLTRRIDAAGLPVLGICGGMQVMGAVRGAKIIPDLRKTDTIIDHHATAGVIPTHEITVAEGSQLARFMGAGRHVVNSAHYEALTDAPEGVFVSAEASDGVIEAVEWADRAYAVGVQWHPELSAGSPDEPSLADKLLDGLLEAARG